MTPALLVPDTPEGRLYKQLPAILGQIANQVQAQSARLNLISALNGWMTEGAAEHLHALLLAQLENFDFASAQAIGTKGMIAWLTQMPLFTWDADAPSVKVPIWVDVKDEIQEIAIPIQSRRPGLYSVHPALAYAYLGRMPNKLGQRGYIDEGGGVCYAVYDPQMGVLFSQGFVNTTTQAIADMVFQLQYGANYVELGRTLWSLIPEFRQIREDVISTPEGNFIDRREVPDPDYAEATVYPWPASFANHPNALIAPFGELATKLHKARGKANRAEILKMVGIVAAIMGGFAAIESIASQGAGFGNVAKLIGSIDNLPGVDLGPAGDIAKGISGGLNLAQTIPGGVNMFDFDPSDLDLSLEDIGSTLSPDFDLSIFDDFGLEATDLLGDEFGNIFTVAGDAVTLSPEDYIKSIYIDEGGNYRDFTNNVILPQSEADYIFNESGADNDAVFQEIATRATMLSGQTFVSQEGSVNRPAGVPSPANQAQVPVLTQVSQELLSWVKTLTSYSLAKEQLQKTGRYNPPYQTNPTGTPRSQVPGMPIQRADGSIVTNNGNGTQTIQYADGRVQTVPSGFSASGQIGGALLPGVSNQTLLLVGGGLLAALLIARR